MQSTLIQLLYLHECRVCVIELLYLHECRVYVIDLKEERDTVHWKLPILGESLNLIGWPVVSHSNQWMEMYTVCAWNRKGADDITRNWNLIGHSEIKTRADYERPEVSHHSVGRLSPALQPSLSDPLLQVPPSASDNAPSPQRTSSQTAHDSESQAPG